MTAMRPRASPAGLVVLGCAIGSAVAVLETAAAVPAVVSVTAGRPTEYAFRVGAGTPVPAGAVTIRVENRGRLAHTFRLCARPVAIASAGTCTGPTTPTIPPGRAATLKTSLAAGAYAFLSTAPGDLARGMKGVLRVVTRVSAVPAPPTAPPAPGPEKLQGDPVAGARVFAANACAGCHTMAAAGAHGVMCPNLDLTKPSQATVRSRVTLGAYGGGGVEMPSFALSPTELDDLAAFVYASTHAG